MSEWRWRLVIIVPSASKPLADTIANLIDAGNVSGSPAFTTQLSPSGLRPATHYAVYTSATDELVATMSMALESVEGAMFWRHGTDGVLVASNVTPLQSQQWGWQQSVVEAGLKPISTQTP